MLDLISFVIAEVLYELGYLLLSLCLVTNISVNLYWQTLLLIARAKIS